MQTLTWNKNKQIENYNVRTKNTYIGYNTFQGYIQLYAEQGSWPLGLSDEAERNPFGRSETNL